MTEPDTANAAIDAAREAFIEAATAEVDATEPVAAEVAAQAEVKPQEPAATPEAAPKEPEARAYRKLLDGEAKLRAEREAFKAERIAAEAELNEFRTVKAKLKADPVAYLKAAGLDDKAILEVLQEAQARDMGKLAPTEVQARLAVKEAERIAREAEERIEARFKAADEARQVAEAQKFVADYQAGIATFVTSELSAYPQLAAIAAAGKPVAQAIYQTAVEMASANPSGPAPKYADVAAQLNSQLADLANSLVVAPTAPTTDTPTPIAPGKPVLRNSSTQAQSSPAPDTKPKSYNEFAADIRSKVLAAHGITSR